MKKYTDLTSFEDCCKVMNCDPKKAIPDFQFFPEHHRVAMQSLSKIVIITEAANKLANKGKTWIANYNTSDPKFEAWMYLRDNPDGSSGFRLGAVGSWNTGSDAGSRLAFIEAKVGRFIVNKFLRDYENWYVRK